MQARLISTPTKRKKGLSAHQEIVRGTYYILMAFVIQVAPLGVLGHWVSNPINPFPSIYLAKKNTKLFL